MNNHHALVYRGPEEFLTGVGGFVRRGLAEGDRVLVVAPEPKLARLGREVGRPAGLDLWDGESAYRQQARIFQLTLDYVNGHPGHTRLVAEQDLAGRSDLEVEAYMCVEAAANAVYRDLPVTVVCAYDASALPSHVVDTCRQTHGGLLDGARVVDNPRYVEPTEFLAGRCVPSEPPASAATLVCESVDDLGRARRLVADEAGRAGLGDHRVHDLVLAANEVLTNALTHAQPPARLDLFLEAQVFVCLVRDRGSGLVDPFAGYVLPSEHLASGRGLVLARQLCDSVEIASDETGTHVRLMMVARG